MNCVSLHAFDQAVQQCWAWSLLAKCRSSLYPLNPGPVPAPALVPGNHRSIFHVWVWLDASHKGLFLSLPCVTLCDVFTVHPCMNMFMFIHLFANGNLGRFHFSAVVDSAALIWPCKHLFEALPCFRYLVGFLDHMGVTFFIFWAPFIAISIPMTPLYGAQGFQLPRALINISFSWFNSRQPDGCAGTEHGGFDLLLPGD